MDKKFAFIISGIFSITIYILFFSLIIFYFFNKQEIVKKFAIKSKSIEISLVQMPKIDQKSLHKKSVKKKRSVKKKIGSKSPKSTPIEDIKNLFSKIEIKNSENKKIIQKEQNMPPSRFKGESQKRKKAKDILKNLNLKDVKSVVASKEIKAVTGDNDKYYSKIYKILYENWFPSPDSAGSSAKVKIFIDRYGNFDYKVLLFSNSEIFNKELVQYLEFLKTVSFPPPKENKEIVVYFEAKE